MCTITLNLNVHFNSTFCQEFKACMANYVDLLKQKMAMAAQGARVLPEAKEREICFVVNTAEYCADTAPQLEDLIKQKIDAGFKDRVDLTAEQELFYDAIAGAIRALVAGLQSRVEPGRHLLPAPGYSACIHPSLSSSSLSLSFSLCLARSPALRVYACSRSRVRKRSCLFSRASLHLSSSLSPLSFCCVGAGGVVVCQKNVP